MIKKHIPNAITCMNLFTGCIAVYLAFKGNYEGSFYAILISAVFDFFDGMAARLLKAYSPLGKELDSLADMVSFGLAPGAIVFSMLAAADINEWIPFVGFIIPVFSGLRLAKFNIDERQTTSFLGMPTPANAIFWGGLAFSYSQYFIANSFYIILLAIGMSVLLVLELPMFALKVKSVKWKNNQIQYLFILVSVALFAYFQMAAFPITIAWYIGLSIILYLLKLKP